MKSARASSVRRQAVQPHETSEAYVRRLAPEMAVPLGPISHFPQAPRASTIPKSARGHRVAPKQALSVDQLEARVGASLTELVTRRTSLTRFFAGLGERLFDAPLRATSYVATRKAFAREGLLAAFDRILAVVPASTRRKLMEGKLPPALLMAKAAKELASWRHSPAPISRSDLETLFRKEGHDQPFAQLTADESARLATGKMSAAAAVAMVEASHRRDVDVIIVGAGMAGLAAADELMRQGRSVVVLEAKDRIGGRAHTDELSFGVPIDLGGAWLHSADRNPMTPIAEQLGFTIVDDPHHRRTYGADVDPVEGGKRLDEALARVEAAWSAAAKRGRDISAALASPRPPTTWERLGGAIAGPLSMGVDVDQVSTMDFHRSVPEHGDRLLLEGFGTLVQAYGHGLPVELETPVSGIEWGNGKIEVSAGGQTYRGQKLLVTTSAGVLASGALNFDPPLPDWKVAATQDVRMAHYEKIVLQFDRDLFPGVPEATHAYEMSDPDRGMSFLMRPFGSRVAIGFLGGRLAEKTIAQGKEVAIGMILDALEKMYGPEVKQAVVEAEVTEWGEDPHTLGAYSATAPGAYFQRAALTTPLDERIFFAGEACSRDWSMCIPGAFESGQEVAAQVSEVLTAEDGRAMTAA